MSELSVNNGSPNGTRGHSLTEMAYLVIKRDIVRCELEPGRQVTEEQLAQRYEVGRAAVRAAIKRLYQEQLIQVAPRRGYLVAPITLKHVHDIFELRLLLEPAAANRAAGKVDGDLLKHLNDLCQARYRPGDHESAAAFLSANTEFHNAIAHASGNTLLSDTITSLLDKVERVHNLSHMLQDRNEEAFHEHHELVEALVDGDGDRAERVMIDQILSAKAFVVDAILSSHNVQSVNVAVR